VAEKTHRVEARVSPDQRERIERAVSAVGQSPSEFVVDAAVQRADEVIAAATSTVVSSDYFDELLAALDQPESATRLAAAAERARRSARIVAR
jgi:uncharacterized protein (DUF1778 family)